ncbi:uncharacterized protein LOC131018204 [Salvia miltiorrhiza]|uniref:uncharacterized protein LOC131018204 n=1 Tax=Salvia miltiorrhiza TaxID=226208 RepID=UPI0025AC27F5|nr:uncharacterized protein LOC131018204 [Salvia miltiorrhiza]
MGWRLLEDQDALVCRILKAKYFPNGDFLTARKDDCFRVSAMCPPGFDGTCVCDLMNPTTGSWDTELLHDLLGDADAQSALGIPLKSNLGPDKLVWHFEEKGRYTVKTAYKLASSLTLDAMYSVDGLWNKLWKVKVPPKVRNFLWRAARNNLPSKEQLLSRGVVVGGECETCKTSIENLWHKFSFARLRRLAGAQIIGGSNEELKARVCMVMWQIWKDRNGVIWKGVLPSPGRSTSLAAECRVEWLLARRKRTAQNPQAPPATSIGIVIRDHEGQFMTGKSLRFLGLHRVEEGELMGIKEALS